MKAFLKQLVKEILVGLGLRTRRRSTNSPPKPNFWSWIHATQHIRTVIDIGANDGEFAAFLAKSFSPSVTYAFEPSASCIDSLRAKAAIVPNLRVFHVALSDHEGSETLYENSHGPSTSLLPVSEIHKAEFPDTASAMVRTIPVSSLDGLLNQERLEKNIFIKVDVEGLEDRVIRGGRGVFSAAQCVLIEMSFLPLRCGQPLFEEVHSLLVELGFRLAGFKNQIDSTRSGQPLFAHCLYVRSEQPFGSASPEDS